MNRETNRQIAVRAVTTAISGGMIFLRPFFWDFAKVLSYCSAFYLRYFYITEFRLILYKQTKFYTSWMSFCLLHCLLHIYFVLTVSKRTMCFTSFGLHSCHQWTESWWLSTNTSTASITSSLLLDRLPPQPDCRQSYRQHRFFSSVDSRMTQISVCSKILLTISDHLNFSAKSFAWMAYNVLICR